MPPHEFCDILEEMDISTSRLAKIKGVTTQTIRRWVKQGRYPSTRTHGGHLRIKYTPAIETILYARVSSKKQISSIAKQRELLNECHTGKFMYDIGSGFNFKRRNFVRILESAMSGNAIRVVVTTPDRLSRSGLTFLVKTIQFYGGEVVFLEDDNITESFDIATLIAFLTSFCNSQSGKRNSKRYQKNKNLSKK